METPESTLYPDSEPIDVQTNPFAYNKRFDPDDPSQIDEWIKMRPTHISKEAWPIKVYTLKELLKTPSVQTEHDKAMVVMGWKSGNGLLPKDNPPSGPEKK